LADSISDYVAWHRNSFKVTGLPATRLVFAFMQAFPELAETFDATNLPDHIYAREIVSLGVIGINKKITTALWEQFYIAYDTLFSVAYKTGNSIKTISRHKSVFPENVATQLYRIAHELASPERFPINPQTPRQRWEDYILEKFPLTNRQLEVLLEFCEPTEIGRKAIAAKLNISLNTLKSHIRKIIRKTDSSTMNEAATKARFLFIENEREFLTSAVQ